MVEKVYSAEMESVIHGMDNIAEVTVYGEKNLIMGNIVYAKVSLLSNEDHQEATIRIKKFCREK